MSAADSSSRLFAFLLFAQITLLFMVQPCFAYSSPPHSIVGAHNSLSAPALHLVPCKNSTPDSYENPVSCAEAELITIYPSVDDRISSDSPANALWSYAYSASDQDKQITDSDGCISYYHKTFQQAVFFPGIIIYFGNSTYMVRNISASPAVIPQPALLSASGARANISLSGIMIFEYIFDSTIGYMECVNGSCGCSEMIMPSRPINITRQVESNLTYDIEGTAPLYFLSKPVLGEQWESNPRFQGLVFSNRKFYSVSILDNRIETGPVRFYSFSIANITNSSNSAWKVVSSRLFNLTNISVQEERVNSIPASIQEGNSSFFYIYSFDSIISGAGRHNLTILLSDHFLANFSSEFQVQNRLLTYGNISAEDGSQNISNRNLYRPSLPIAQQEASTLIMGFAGVLGLLVLFIALFNK